MEPIFKRHFVLTLISAFLLGGLAFWGGQKLWTTNTVAAPRETPDFENLFGSRFFKQSRDPFQEMDRMHREMMKNFGGGEPSDFRVREDDDFVYDEIDTGTERPERLEVGVQNGLVTIKGEVQSKTEDAGRESVFSSTFVRSFPAPEGVDTEKFQIERPEGKIVIKFPKLKG